MRITLSNGTAINAGYVKGNTGAQGPQGLTGATGPQGIQGLQGINGISTGSGCYNCPTMISAISLSTLSLSNAITYCNNLTESGFTNWRIPTLDEFEFIRDELNIPVSSLDCWTKDFQIVGTGAANWTSPVYISTNRNIIVTMYGVCVR